MKPLDLSTFPLDRPALIEASAGTGKTYSITRIYLRQLLEGGRRAEQIAVATFTEAAAAELLSRVSQLLEQAIATLNGEPDKAELQALLQPHDPAEALARLRLASLSLDAAPIHTIHGLCARWLDEFGVAAGELAIREELHTGNEFFERAVAQEWMALGQRDDDAARRLVLTLGSKEQLHAWCKTLRSTEDPEFALAGDKPVPSWDESRWQALLAMDCKGLSTAQKKPGRIFKSEDEAAALWGWLCDPAGTPPRIVTDVANAADVSDWKTPTGKPDPALAAELEALAEWCAQVRAQYWAPVYATFADSYANVRRRMRRLLDESDTQTFDELITRLRDALTARPELTSLIRKHYPCVLIDEFQDTSPAQAEIFRRIYLQAEPPGSLVLIGDPKQSIYAFRNADVHAYLATGEQIDEANHYSLATNYRSTATYVEVLNQLFDVDQPFGSIGIDYQRVAAQRDALPGPAFVLDWLDAASADPAQTVQQVADLIAAGIRAKDIGILVRSNASAERLQVQLSEAGIAASTRLVQSVFATEQATGLLTLLAALEQPNNEARIRTLMASSLFAFSRTQIDAADWADWSQWMLTVASEIPHSGIYPAVTAALVRAAECGGTHTARELTNLLHLAELAQAEMDAGASLAALKNWLGCEIAQFSGSNNSSDRTSHELRMDTDADAVVITTLHRAKGLEYPVCLIHDLWNRGKPLSADKLATFVNGPFVFHEGHRLRVDMGSAQRAVHARQRVREEHEEEIRLGYVGLTRGRDRCHFSWPAKNKTSAMAWLFHAPETRPADLADIDNDGGQRLASLTGELDALQVRQASGAVTLPEPSSAELAAAPKPELSADTWRVTSFTGMARNTSGPEAVVDGEEASSHRSDDRPEVGRPAFRHAPGAQFGNAFHAALEWQVESGGDVREHARSALLRYGLGSEATLVRATAELAETVWTRPLPVVDSALDQLDRLRAEMAFYITLASHHGAELADVLHPYPQHEGTANHLRERGATEGLLHGLIDLVAEHDGRFYVMDYKTNSLGPLIEHYDGAAMDRAMQSHRYDLQYLLYTVALHRWLGSVQADYDYETHFGGVFYLFVRGMNREDEHGIWFTRPDPALISALDEVLDDA